MNLRKTKEGTILAICDSELLGKTFEEGKSTLDLDKYKGFYEGRTVKEEDDSLSKAISSSDSINAVGKRAIESLKKAGFDITGIKTVQKVPHLQVYKL